VLTEQVASRCRCTCSDNYSGTLCQLAPTYIISGADDNSRNGRYERLVDECSGFPVYQKGGRGGYVLFQPNNHNEWAVSTSDHKTSCASTGLIHSGLGSCPLSPDGAGCASRWREWRDGVIGSQWELVRSIAVSVPSVPTCTAISTPHAGCIVPLCTDIDTPYAGCVIPPGGPKEVVFVLDDSGSMDNGRLTTCKQSLLDDILRTKLQAHDRAGLVTLNSGSVPLATYSNAQRQALENTITDLQPYGATPLWQAMSQAISMLTSQANSQWIVALTDGAAGDDPSAVGTALRTDAGRTIHVLFITVDLSSADMSEIRDTIWRDDSDSIIPANGGLGAITQAWTQAGERLLLPNLQQSPNSYGELPDVPKPHSGSSSTVTSPGIFCAGYRHADRQDRQIEFVSSAVSSDEQTTCECTDLATMQQANVTTSNAMECDPIVMCKLRDTSEVCVCHGPVVAIPTGITTINVVSTTGCIHADGSNGLMFGIEMISPACQLAIIFCAAALCGFMAYGRDHHVGPDGPKRFIMIEFLDASMDVGTLAYSLAAHDMRFANDDGLVKTAVTVSVVLSVLMFIFEQYLYKYYKEVLQDKIPFLVCLHLVVEDFFQTFVYLWVGGTHFKASITAETECDRGGLCPVFAVGLAIAQAVTFTAVKMWELWQDTDDGANPAAANNARSLTPALEAVVVNDSVENPIHGVVGTPQAVVAMAREAPPARAALVGGGFNPSRADVLSLARNVHPRWNDEREVDEVITQCNGDLKQAHRWFSEQAEQSVRHSVAPAG
jgi:uncharacterized protein YegL